MPQIRIMAAAVAAAAGLLSGVAPAFAQAPLPPGTTSDVPVPILATGVPPFGGALLQSVQTVLFGSNGPNTIAGNVTSAVYRTPTGFLDFAYQFTFDPTTNIVIDTISLSSFTRVPGLAVGQTSEDIDGPGGLFLPATATGAFAAANRPNVNGNGINTNLLTGVTRDESTFVFLVRTRTRQFTQAGSASVQGGGISAFTLSPGAFVPVAAAAPEPGSLWLLALGATALALRLPPIRTASQRSFDR